MCCGSMKMQDRSTRSPSSFVFKFWLFFFRSAFGLAMIKLITLPPLIYSEESDDDDSEKPESKISR